MRQRRLKNEINVVPYIDVMLVLLVIFMVTAPMMTTASIDLPSVGKAATAPTAPLEVQIKADEGLVLTDRGGNGKEIRVDRKELLAMIRTAQARNPEQPVLIAGDKNVKYEAVLSVMDGIQIRELAEYAVVEQSTLSRAVDQLQSLGKQLGIAVFLVLEVVIFRLRRRWAGSPPLDTLAHRVPFSRPVSARKSVTRQVRVALSNTSR